VLDDDDDDAAAADDDNDDDDDDDNHLRIYHLQLPCAIMITYLAPLQRSVSKTMQSTLN